MNQSLRKGAIMKTTLYTENFLEMYRNDHNYKDRVDAYVKHFNKQIDKNVTPGLMERLYVPKGSLQVHYNIAGFTKVKRSRYQKACLVNNASVNAGYLQNALYAITLPTVTYKTQSGKYFTFLIDQHLIMSNGIDFIIPSGIVELSTMPLNK